MMIWQETNTPPFLSPFHSLSLSLADRTMIANTTKTRQTEFAEGIARRTCKGPVAMILHFIRRQQQGLPASGSAWDAFMSTRTLHTISAGGESYHIISIVLQSSKTQIAFLCVEKPSRRAVARDDDDVPDGVL